MVHGGVDGYSRLPVYLRCSNNNRASTVLKLFQEAVSTYGLPSRIRTDKGGENVDVSMFLLTHPLRGPGRSTVLVGKSVHNQRIERLWRDVYEGVVGFYHGLFNHLESVGMLDPNDDLHIFCLHTVFLPRINRHLNTWKKAWVKHPIRSEQNHSPEQLWVRGLHRIAHSGGTIAKEVFETVTHVSCQFTIRYYTNCYVHRMKQANLVLTGRVLLPAMMMKLTLLMCQTLLAHCPFLM